MVYYLLQRRRKHQADQFRNTNLVFTAFKAMYDYNSQMQQKGSLQSKICMLTKARNQKRVQTAIILWLKTAKDGAALRSYLQNRDRKLKEAFFR
jgi:hypothetical protein